MLRYILLLFLFSTNCFSAIPFSHAKEIFAKLEKTTGYQVPLSIEKTNMEINAYTTTKRIIVTKGLLLYVNTDAELAMVLAHELGHWSVKDSSHAKPPKDMEVKADLYGYTYCTKAGYMNCLGILYRFQQTFGNDETDGVHPKWSDRIQYVHTHYKEPH